MNRPSTARHIEGVRGFIFDIDGTLALGDRLLNGYQALPGAIELIDLLTQRNIPFVAFTNGSTKTPAQLSAALGQAGIHIDASRAITPPRVAVSLFQQEKYKRILVLGTPGVWQPLADAGFDVVVSPEKANDVDAVFIGWYPEFRLADIEAAAQAVWGGAKLYTVSTAPFLATKEGRSIGISHAITAAVQSVTNAPVSIVGKPSPHAFELARSLLNMDAAQIAIVGDDLTLEHAMALQEGALSIAVHSGLASISEIEKLAPGQQPHLSLAGVEQLLEILR
ncbi:HAD-IIA family hydrolase [Eoetvoesiella caeni]|uniref:HAD superfamily hydrolase (TIGR01450 family) n=1 Tax=Eoetvoesiella caeni TaxID=645616 RepID=A0A366H1K4_9BURK|nr:HAD hydrolase-like protein [Eoetvoesiella caeni]MCI2810823.1 HAD hydrolase-like protein [Eoetvoesiella caeni]NYT56720.1 HAD hydrolase-like protein [Eoetvoesiella caeni]RBP35771.1 HAD superfamily hydrolase (TIGR01450 family) [Eoetvoesiella caeni]